MKSIRKLNRYLFVLFCSFLLSNGLIELSSAADGLLRTPADGSYITDNTPTLGWYLHNGVSKYQIQMSSNSDCSAPIVDEELSHPTQEYTVGTAQLDGLYYFRVREYSSVFPTSWGDWSDIWNFTIDTIAPSKPLLSHPIENAVIGASTPALIWLEVTEINFDYYEILVDDNSDFSSPERTLYTYDKSELHVLVSPGLSDGYYYWLVRAVDKAGTASAWSNYRVFRIDTVPPSEAPTLISPLNNSFLLSTTVSFDWDDVSEAVTYRVEWTTDPTWTGYISVGFAGSSDYSNTFTANTRWYWRVKARDLVHNTGPASETWTFLIDTIAPDIPDLISPVEDDLTNSSIITFNWSSISDAVEYQIQIGTSVDLISPLIEENTDQTEYTELAIFSDVEDRFYWRVKAKDLAGNWGDWSVTRNIVVDTVAPTATGPDNFSYDEGTIDNKITWVVPENHYKFFPNKPLHYDFYLDSDLIVSDVMEDEDDNITISCDGLTVGEHDYLLILTDPAGNTLQDVVVVTVFAAVEEFTPLIPIGSLFVIVVCLCVIRCKRRKEE